MTGRSWGRRMGRPALVALVVLGLVGVTPPPQATAQLSLDVERQFTGLREALFSGLANQIGTLPNPTGGGFTYQFDPALGVFARTTESFGPVFANRAETTGKGKFTFDLSFTRYTFDEIDGVNLRKGGVQSLFATSVPVAPGVDVALFDLVTVRQSTRADVTSIGALYGVTDRIDVGIVIPILSVQVKERVTEEAFVTCLIVNQQLDLRLCDAPTRSGIDFIPNDVETTGIGDIVLRSKWNFVQFPDLLKGRAGVAVGLDLKLPTGDKGDRPKFTNPGQGADILQNASTQRFQIGDPPTGTGILRVAPNVVASGSWSLPLGMVLAPHVTVGAELGTTQGITNDLIYQVGVDYTFLGRVTISADLLGRHAFSVDRRRVTPRGLLDDDFAKIANPDILTGSFGLKVNPPLPRPFDTILVFVNFLIPLNQTGLRDDLTPTIGLEWSF